MTGPPGTVPPGTPPRTPGRSPGGRTRVVGVIGDPVTHSLSPTLHNAAFAACGLDWVYVALPVPRGQGGAAVAAARHLGLAGFNVTMPHKEDVAAACDELTPDAAALASVNTVVIDAGGVARGASTDGEGFLAALAGDGIEVAGRPVLVLGAGGAARAVVLALGRAGAAVTVAARRPEASETAAALAPGAKAMVLADAAGQGDAYEVVVNATPLGMGGEAPPLDVGRLGPRQVVVDLVYHPAETPLLAAARARGVRTQNGLPMLVHQAARSFTLWTGVEAPLAVMQAAAREALAAR
ncbi:MAG: shikimate dehydrogenase [Acidimicrobiia bacterium]